MRGVLSEALWTTLQRLELIFGEDSKVREVWIAGLRHEVDPASKFPLKGVYALAAPDTAGVFTTLPESVTIDADEKRLSFALPKPAEQPATKDAEGKEPGGERGRRGPAEAPSARGEGANFDDARAGFTVAGKPLGIDGTLRGTVRYVSAEATFTPYYSLTQRDRSRLSYLAEVVLDDRSARALRRRRCRAAVRADQHPALRMPRGIAAARGTREPGAGRFLAHAGKGR
jgi:hypothetical protein